MTIELIETPIGRVSERPLNIEDEGVRDLLGTGRFYCESIRDNVLSGIPAHLLALVENLGYESLTMQDYCRLNNWLDENPGEGKVLRESLFTEPPLEGIEIGCFLVLGEIIHPDVSTTGKLHVYKPEKWKHLGGRFFDYEKTQEKVITIDSNKPFQRDIPSKHFSFNECDLYEGFPCRRNSEGQLEAIQRDKGQFQLEYPRGVNELTSPNGCLDMALCCEIESTPPRRITSTIDLFRVPDEHGWGSYVIHVKEKQKKCQ